jgi:hypothetical protein
MCPKFGRDMNFVYILSLCFTASVEIQTLSSCVPRSILCMDVYLLYEALSSCVLISFLCLDVYLLYEAQVRSYRNFFIFIFAES